MLRRRPGARVFGGLNLVILARFFGAKLVGRLDGVGVLATDA